jgi:hypothetical protein
MFSAIDQSDFLPSLHISSFFIGQAPGARSKAAQKRAQTVIVPPIFRALSLGYHWRGGPCRVHQRAKLSHRAAEGAGGVGTLFGG